jgi:hypothetical protein
MPSLIKRTNIRYLSNNIDILLEKINRLTLNINIPIHYFKLIKRKRIIQTNKQLLYNIIYKTLLTIYLNLDKIINRLNNINKQLICIKIYIDSKYTNTYTKLITN